MTKTMTLAAAVFIALAAGKAATAAPPVMTYKAEHVTALRQPKSHVLYAQTAHNSGNGVLSQVFESESAQYDSQGADDFVVPKNKTWTVTEVDVSGEYFDGSGPADSENVFFYAEGANGLPGDLIGLFVDVKGSDSSGSFAIALAKGIKLTSGRYWVSVSANLSGSLGGEWGWNTTTSDIAIGNPAAWQNPPGGFRLPCARYTIETHCVGSNVGADQIFMLIGRSKG